MNYKNLKRKVQTGFTFTELLVTIVVLVFILGAIYSGYTLSQRALREREIVTEISQNGRVISERMTREIRQAKEIVTELSEEESGATSTILFEDGHISEPYHYISYFKEDNNLCREVIGYYFSGDPEQTLVPWDATPPEGQEKKTKILQELQTIGEYVINLKIFGSELIQVALTLEKKNKILELKTKTYGRNL